ncbi:hypothetical protein ACIG0C_34560 [Kitasatospora aureofaciens]|uniref:Uncharacterized protein n=1 Tax=Kitasatospora aureofaciens TaxID=1894 RepID=A0A1E7NEX9_KITAU|nr:hypothetical protein [Kitasatospora aureofaciens]ARF82457.1 hypothetical protein B6264_29500 [Kitasatospora aureofaciens]OEV39259.1 hypothetical protein HS99_0000635 [Kitasatospora aureofaciens]GGU88367.1 hypothetical protein GCM10010502_46350 [Kitasatospora aureofaciens]
MRVRSAEVNRLPQPPSVPGTQLPVLVRYGHRSWLIPAVLLVAVVVVDALTPSSFASVSWLALVPVVAAAVVRHTGGRRTDDTALLAVRHSPVRLPAEPGRCGG